MSENTKQSDLLRKNSVNRKSQEEPMQPTKRRKLSIAFSVYNKARAAARRDGDMKRIDLLNKTLGRMVKDASLRTFKA